MATNNCVITGGYTFPCRTNQGGVKAVYIGSFNDTAMTMGLSGSQVFSFSGATVSFFTFTQRQEQASLTNTLVQSVENGTTSWDQTLIIELEQVDSVLGNTINVLAQGIWRIIVLDQNGAYWLVGKSQGAYVTTGTGGPHKAYGDGNKTTITFMAKEPIQASSVATAAALSVIV